MEVDITISGLKEMEKNLLALGADMGAKTLRNALRDGAKIYLEDMHANMPIGTVERTVKKRDGSKVRLRPGFLRHKTKIRTRLNRRGQVNRRFGKKDIAIVSVGTFGVPFAPSVEYGNSRMAAQPYIRPAVRRSESVVARVKDRLARRIELAAKKLNKQ